MLAPIASPKSATQLAEWIAQHEPQLFAALTREAGTALSVPGKLGGITDWLSSIGTGVTSAVKNVGTFLTSSQGLATLGTLGGAYLQTKSQQNVLATQVALAQAGMAPAPIAYTPGANGVNTPIYLPTQQTVTPGLLAQLQPSFLQRNGIWLALGGAGILALLLLRSR